MEHEDDLPFQHHHFDDEDDEENVCKHGPDRRNTLKMFEKIKNLTVSTVHFERHLRMALKQNVYDHTALDDRGLNILMVAMVAKNVHAMNILSNMGLWSECVHHIVPLHCQESDVYGGKTVTELAVKVVRNPMVTKALADVEKLEKTLPEISKLVRRGDLARVIEYAKKHRNNRMNPRLTLSPIDTEGNTPLMYACMGRTPTLDVLNYLLTSLEAPLRSVNNKDQNILHVAVSHGQLPHLRYILNCAEDRNEEEENSTLLSLLDMKDSDDKTPADLCAKVGDTLMLQRIVQASPSVVDPKCLMKNAAAFGSCQFLRGLNKKYDLSQVVGCTGDDQKTVLHYAVAHCQPHVVRYVLTTLKEQLSPSALQDYFRTPDRFNNNVFHLVASTEKLTSSQEAQDETLRLLLDFALSLEEEGVLQSMLAAKNVYRAVDWWLLVSGKDKGEPAFHYVHVRRSEGTLFKRKIRSGLVDVALFGDRVKSGWGTDLSPDVKKGLWARSKMNCLERNIKDATPFLLALAKDNTSLVKIFLDLLQRGTYFDINQSDRYKMTPLHLAAIKGDGAMFTCLRAAGGNAKALDNENRTLTDLARLNENFNIVHLFQVGHNKKKLADALDSIAKKVEGAKKELQDARNVASTGVDPMMDLAATCECHVFGFFFLKLRNNNK